MKYKASFLFLPLLFLSSCDFMESAARSYSNSWEFQNESSREVRVIPSGNASESSFYLESGERKTVSWSDDDEMDFTYSPQSLTMSKNGVTRIVKFTD